MHGAWMWYYGDYEIYHSMKTNLRRQEWSAFVPPLWKVSTPYPSVRFKKTFTCEGGAFRCFLNGQGRIRLDKVTCPEGQWVTLTPGQHTIVIAVYREEGLPAAFVESDVCPSDGSWMSDYYVGNYSPAGWNPELNDPKVSPEVFPFAYEKCQPVAVEETDIGRLYDFGKELFGFLNLGAANPDDTMEVYYGESREEALDPAHCILLEGVSGQDAYRLRQRAFRYVCIKNAPKELQVDADHEYLPLEKKGSFTCSDPVFNKIYDTAVRTFHLNCREAFLDGIKRDRWIWGGDAYQSARINSYLFADKQIEQRTAIGLLGKAPIEQHINTILDYSFLWIIGLKEHDLVYGDREYLKRAFPMAVKLMNFCETQLNADGFVETTSPYDWTFIDWADIDKEGPVCAEQILMVAAYKTLSHMASSLDEDGASYDKKADALLEQINKRYWDEAQGAFIDSYRSGKRNVTRHANIFAVMYDLVTPEQRESILTRVLKNDNVPKITTPYFMGYELDVLGKLGEIQQIEQVLSDYWGGMLQVGAETIWEEYKPYEKGIEHYAMYGNKYGRSLCHAWGAGPVYIFGRYYLGVYPTTEGYKTYKVAPNLGGLAHMQGVVPVGDGTVSVEMDKKTLKVKTTKPGGTLVLGGKEYPLPVDKEICIEL